MAYPTKTGWHNAIEKTWDGVVARRVLIRKGPYGLEGWQPFRCHRGNDWHPMTNLDAWRGFKWRGKAKN